MRVPKSPPRSPARGGASKAHDGPPARGPASTSGASTSDASGASKAGAGDEEPERPRRPSPEQVARVGLAAVAGLAGFAGQRATAQTVVAPDDGGPQHVGRPFSVEGALSRPLSVDDTLVVSAGGRITVAEPAPADVDRDGAGAVRVDGSASGFGVSYRAADGSFSVAGGVGGLGTGATQLDAEARVDLGFAHLDAAVRATLGGTLDGTFLARVNLGSDEGTVPWDVLVGFARVGDLRGRANASGEDGLGFSVRGVDWSTSALVAGGGVGVRLLTDLDEDGAWTLSASGDLRAMVFLPLWPADEAARAAYERASNGFTGMDPGLLSLSTARLTTKTELVGRLPEGTLSLSFSTRSQLESLFFRAVGEGAPGVVGFLFANPTVGASFQTSDGRFGVRATLPLSSDSGQGPSLGLDVRDGGARLGADLTMSPWETRLAVTGEARLQPDVSVVGRFTHSFGDAQRTAFSLGLVVGAGGAPPAPVVEAVAGPQPRAAARGTTHALDVRDARARTSLAEAAPLLRTPERVASLIHTGNGARGGLAYLAAPDAVGQQIDAWRPETTFEAGGGVCMNLHILAAHLLQQAGYEAYTAVLAAPATSHAITVFRDPASGKWDAMQYGTLYDVDADTPVDAVRAVFPDVLITHVVDAATGRVAQKGDAGPASALQSFFDPVPRRP